MNMQTGEGDMNRRSSSTNCFHLYFLVNNYLNIWEKTSNSFTYIPIIFLYRNHYLLIK